MHAADEYNAAADYNATAATRSQNKQSVPSCRPLEAIHSTPGVMPPADCCCCCCRKASCSCTASAINSPANPLVSMRLGSCWLPLSLPVFGFGAGATAGGDGRPGCCRLPEPPEAPAAAAALTHKVLTAGSCPLCFCCCSLSCPCCCFQSGQHWIWLGHNKAGVTGCCSSRCCMICFALGTNECIVMLPRIIRRLNIKFQIRVHFS